MKRGLFIAFEGIDGCGKSTQLERVARRLESDGCDVLMTREPGGTVISEKIRDILISPDHGEMVGECELLLYAASRAQHVREKIIPALEKGITVACDRFHLATLAYQGYGRTMPLSVLKYINDFATGGVYPDLTFVFDIDIGTAFKRLSAMGKRPDRIELAGDDFFSRIRRGYRSLADEDPKKIILFDGNRPADALTEEVYARIRAASGHSV